MDFYGIKINPVNPKPTWTSEWEGALVYDEGDNTLYYGTNSGWVEVGSGTASGGIGTGLRTLDPFGDNVPHVIVYYGIVANLEDHSGTDKVRVTAYDMIASVHGGTGTITYGISKNGSSWTENTDPELAYVEYTSVEVGFNSIYLKVTDSLSNEDSAETIITIQNRA